MTAAQTGSPGAGQSLLVTVGVLTFKRPRELAESLAGVLAQLDEVHAADGPFTTELLVIDNDPAASAREAVAGLVHDRVRYAVEPRPGIAAARNRALDEAAGSDLLVFIDDDEIPQPKWLLSLLDTWTDTRSAAVMGRVESVFDEDSANGVAFGPFFRRPRMPSGTEIPVAAAGNLLLDLTQIRELGVRFDPTLGLAGGEDTLFSRQLRRAGGRIVWCDESVADDRVPPERLNRRWLARRSWSQGNATAMIELRLAGSRARRVSARVSAGVHGVGRAAMGAGYFAIGLISRNAFTRGQAERLIFRGGGMIAGAFNVHFAEYKRPDGDESA